MGKKNITISDQIHEDLKALAEKKGAKLYRLTEQFLEAMIAEEKSKAA